MTPSSEAEDEMLRNKLANSNMTKHLFRHVGATTLGNDGVWYAIHTGKLFNYDFEWKKGNDYEGHRSPSSASLNNLCLQQISNVENNKTEIVYDTVSCVDGWNQIICQKVTDGKIHLSYFNSWR